MKRHIFVILAFASLLPACGDGNAGGTPEYQARKAEEARKESEGEKSLYARFDEFATMKSPLKPGKIAGTSSGSIVVLTKLPGGEWEMEGWTKKLSDSGTPRRCLDSAGCKGRHPWVTQDSFRATSAESARTLVRIACDKGAAVRDFQQGVVMGSIYAADCLVEVFDLRSNSMLGSKRIKADKVGEIGKTGILDSTAILKPEPPLTDTLVNPFPAIKNYLDTFGLI